MRRIYILGSCRTPIGKMGGALSSLSSVDLGVIVVKEAIKRSGISSKLIDHVYIGCALQAGLGQNIARQITLRAGLPVTTTAETLNIVCGSGLDAIYAAARMIQSGEAEIVIAGGTESMSNAPFVINKARFGYRMGSPMVDTPLVDTMIYDGLWDAFNNYHMGITAENVAKKYHLYREELDRYAYNSQRKAHEAILSRAFDKEVVPVTIDSKKCNTVVDTDECLRFETTMEGLKKLKPAFKQDGMITAGNSSTISDGAAAVIVASEAVVMKYSLLPEVEWLGGALGGVDPSVMGLGPIESTRKLLAKLGMSSIKDVDLVEANEAFASQAIAVKNELQIPDEKLNVNGGAIALGHPIGASGCRIVVTLIHEMLKKQARIGLATLCIGGGMGCSAMFKAID